MKNPFSSNFCVSILTISLAAFFSSCSYVRQTAYDSTGELCRTRAFVQNDIPSYVRQRFGSQSQVRTAILPLSVSANFAGKTPETDFGVYLAKELQAEIFSQELLPLVEVALRPDWPGKQAEFFSGNYGALQFAREASYDFVLVGLVEKTSGPEKFVVSTKLIEVEAGITVWYGQTEVSSLRNDVQKSASFFGLEDRTPNYINIYDLAAEFVKCTVKKMAGVEDKSWFSW